MVLRLAATAALVSALVACSSTATASHPTPSPSTEPFIYLGSLGAAGCSPGAAFHGWKTSDGFPETGVDSKQGSFWALFFQPVPVQAGKENKIVWRMTGSCDFVFNVTDAEGKPVPLLWGEKHGSSNWNHPVDDFGTGITFPHAGWWDSHVARTNASGDLWLEVV